MPTDPGLRCIGIADKTSTNWAAGASYTRMLIHSLARACEEHAGTELVLFSQQDKIEERASVPAINVIPLSEATYFPVERQLRRLLNLPGKSKPLRGEARLRSLLSLPDGSDLFLAARRHHVSVLLPMLDVPAWANFVKTIGWIPDFQHVYLPELFTESERRHRDGVFRRLAAHASLVMLSSQASREHFVEFAPEQAHKARVSSFPSLFAFEPPVGDPLSTVRRFNLPSKFVLVANQFWKHKNHITVVEAVGRLHQRGIHVPVVMTGLPLDYRDPQNETLSQLLQAIASAGIAGHVTVLGQVAYADLVNLMRTAALIIQPSRFEGWSTIVQDGKALGRPLICSDLPVHREQAPVALGFFPFDSADVLAELLTTHWSDLEPGPDADSEAAALAVEREFARAHGLALLRICEEAYSAP